MCTDVCQEIHMGSDVCWFVQMCTDAYLCTDVYWCVAWCVLMCNDVNRCVLMCTDVYCVCTDVCSAQWCVLIWTDVIWCVLMWHVVCTVLCTERCTEMSDVRVCADVYQANYDTHVTLEIFKSNRNINLCELSSSKIIRSLQRFRNNRTDSNNIESIHQIE